MAEYRSAPEVAETAETLINSVHTHLIGIPITYVFRDKHAKTNGKPVMGKARKVSGLNAWLANDDGDDFFAIEIAEDLWQYLTDDQKVALVDHELSHLWVDTKDGVEVLSVLPHDLEEFRGVVERHGLWQPDLEAFAASMARAGQLILDVDDPAA